MASSKDFKDILMNENALQCLPIGRSTFSALRKNQAIYVDKTRLIYELCRNDAKIFLARPRRFGKSLLITTLESLFQYGLRDFEGLAIAQLWTEPTYQVVTLDFSLIKDFIDIDDFRKQFLLLIADGFREAGYQGMPDLWQWTLWLRRQPDRSLVLLIDEYDAPLTACLNQPDVFEQVQKVFSQLFSRIKSSEGCLRFFFMTGVTKLSNTGIFSGFNNLEDISLVTDFGALLGYTESEIWDSFSAYIEHAAQALEMSTHDVMNEIKHHYDGFCFDEKGGCHVYCPWSVLNFLARPARGFLNYWYESAGHPAVLMQVLSHHDLDHPSAFDECVEVSLDQLRVSQPYLHLQPGVLLFQAGYLTIRSVSANRVALLGYPNEEVTQAMAKLYAEKLLGGKCHEASDRTTLTELLASGSLDQIVERFNCVFNSIDYQQYPIADEATCRGYLQVLMMGADMVARVEVHTAHGRSDLETTAGNRCWFFEIKFARSQQQQEQCLSEGIAQVKDRRYGQTVDDDTTLMRAVLVFSEQRRQFVASALV